MHPAPSLIVFTTTSGTGFGLLALIGLLSAAGWLRHDPVLFGVGVAVALLLVATGLVASTFHLRHPERAWRALSQWRSSWLSREGVMAVVSFPPALVLWAHGLFGLGGGGVRVVSGIVVALCALITVYCTAMIYASLRPIRQWHDPWVPVVYLALSVAGGAVLLFALAASVDRAGLGLGLLVLFSIAAATVVKAMYWRAMRAGAAIASPGSALGMSEGVRVRPLDPPHTAGNYLLREMAFQVGRRHAARLRRLAAWAGTGAASMAVVVAMALSGVGAVITAWLAVAASTIALLIERWLFFAEAEHTVALYYRPVSVPDSER